MNKNDKRNFILASMLITMSMTFSLTGCGCARDKEVATLPAFDDDIRQVIAEETESDTVVAEELTTEEIESIVAEVITEEAATEPETEVATEPVTEAPTEPATETPTPAPTSAPTQAATEAPTSAPTQPATEAPTPAPTQPATEAPTSAPVQANSGDITPQTVVTATLTDGSTVTGTIEDLARKFAKGTIKIKVSSIGIIEDEEPAVVLFYQVYDEERDRIIAEVEASPEHKANMEYVESLGIKTY